MEGSRKGLGKGENRDGLHATVGFSTTATELVCKMLQDDFSLLISVS